MVPPREAHVDPDSTETGQLIYGFWWLPLLYLNLFTAIHHITHHKEPTILSKKYLHLYVRILTLLDILHYGYCIIYNDILHILHTSPSAGSSSSPFVRCEAVTLFESIGPAFGQARVTFSSIHLF
jgi:hypothetical protein